MNRRSLIRKLTYLLLIAALLLPLSYFSQPATVATQNEPASPGGKLAQLRDRFRLGQANLGEIDPAGETIKLATLGLRGVAANILWDKANESKKKEDWTGLQATLDQLAKLQPNYISVWRFQAWNVSYNISVEWDDYHDRYYWVKEGIKFLIRGARYNTMEPRLIYDTGWFTSQKIGIADEHAQFRRLFREDDDPEFPAHAQALRPYNRRDNWLVGQEYFEQAISLVDDRGASIRTMNPLTYFCQPAMCQINFSNGLEEDGTFEEKAKEAWKEADRRWGDYGNRELPTTEGLAVRLNDYELLSEKAEKQKEELDALAPGLRDEIYAEKKAKLAAADREVIDMAPEARSQEEAYRAMGVATRLAVTNQEIAERVKEPAAAKAKELAASIDETQRVAHAISRDRHTINFNYWRSRCQMEKTDSALEGRRLLYSAARLFEDAALPEARESYEKGFAEWRKTLDAFPQMVDDAVGGDYLIEAVKGYGEVLKRLDAPFPKDFVLQNMVDAYRQRNPTVPLPGQPEPIVPQPGTTPAPPKPPEL
ncbi:MAG TPA: hypothetical protein VMV10_16180 [Pirellulales bacterium]|nr:hypothetical protein [Pirellulales bacterium]